MRFLGKGGGRHSPAHLSAPLGPWSQVSPSFGWRWDRTGGAQPFPSGTREDRRERAFLKAPVSKPSCLETPQRPPNSTESQQAGQGLPWWLPRSGKRDEKALLSCFLQQIMSFQDRTPPALASAQAPRSIRLALGRLWGVMTRCDVRTEVSSCCWRHQHTPEDPGEAPGEFLQQPGST